MFSLRKDICWWDASLLHLILIDAIFPKPFPCMFSHVGTCENMQGKGYILPCYILHEKEDRGKVDPPCCASLSPLPSLENKYVQFLCSHPSLVLTCSPRFHVVCFVFLYECFASFSFWTNDRRLLRSLSISPLQFNTIRSLLFSSISLGRGLCTYFPFRCFISLDLDL